MSVTDDMTISFDGGNTYYKLKCEVVGVYPVRVYPMTCPTCGGSLELKYGYGKCPFCNTNSLRILSWRK